MLLQYSWSFTYNENQGYKHDRSCILKAAYQAVKAMYFYSFNQTYTTYAEILFIYQLNSGKFLSHGPFYYIHEANIF